MRFLKTLKNKIENDVIFIMISSIIALIGFVILIQFILTYSIFLNKSSDIYIQNVENNMELLKKDIETMFGDIRKKALDISTEPEVSSLFYRDDFSKEEKKLIKGKLSTNLDENINDILIYNSSTNKISNFEIINVEPSETKHFQIVEKISLVEFSKTGRFDTLVYRDSDDYNYISIVYFPIKGSKNAVIININEYSMFELVRRYRNLLNDNFLITIENGTVIYGNSNATVGDIVEDVEKFDNDDVIIRVNSNSLDFNFSLKIKNKDIRDSVPMSENLVIIIAGISILFLALSLMFFVFRRLSKPIKKMEYNLSHSEERLTKIKKEQKLINLLTVSPDEKETLNRLLMEINSPFDCNTEIFLIRINISDKTEYSREYVLLNRFTVINVFDELISEIAKNEIIAESEDTIIIIAEKAESDRASLEKKFIYGKDVLYRQLGFKVKFAVGNIYTMNEISNAYKEIVKLSELHYLLGSDVIVYPEMKHREAQLMNIRTISGIFKEQLFNKDIDKAKITLKEIIEGISEGNPDDARLDLLKIYIIISDFSNTLKTIYSEFEDIIASGIYYELVNADNLNEASEILVSHIDYIDSFIKKQDPKHSELVNRVKKILETEYSDVALCVDSIADKVRISPFYLSKIFKKATIQTIPEYLLNIRLSVACNLLTDTNLPVSEIIKKIGFSSTSYFTVVFKKKMLCTPSEYRKNYGEKSNNREENKNDFNTIT